MHRILLLFALLLLTSFPSFGKKIPGYFISNQGDTIPVHFKVSVGIFGGSPDYGQLQGKAVYVNEAGERHVLRPADALELCLYYKNDTTRMLSRVNTLGLITSLFGDNSYLFLKLEEDGPVKLFSYEQKSHGGFSSSGMPMGMGVSYTYDRYVLQYRNQPLHQVRGISFRRDMMAFFSDDPDLVEKIEQRLYRKENIALIVKEYNNHQAKKRSWESEAKLKSGF